MNIKPIAVSQRNVKYQGESSSYQSDYLDDTYRQAPKLDDRKQQGPVPVQTGKPTQTASPIPSISGGGMEYATSKSYYPAALTNYLQQNSMSGGSIDTSRLPPKQQTRYSEGEVISKIKGAINPKYNGPIPEYMARALTQSLKGGSLN